jgi:hypothetical protein
METIRDNMGRMIATQSKVGDRIVTRDWSTNKMVASYDTKSNKTLSWNDNKITNGDQSLRFLKK